MENISPASLLLIVISVGLLIYTFYIFFDQKSNLRFMSQKSKWTPLIALLLIVIGIANYFYNGQKLEDLCAFLVLLIFSIIMVMGRSGIGETGIYIEGIKMPWKNINRAYVKEDEGKVVLTYIRKKTTRTMELHHTTVDEVEDYLRKKRKIYHFAK